MSALTAPRNTPWRSGDTNNDPIAAGANIHAGGITAINAAGYLVPASTSTTLTARGVAQASVDNSAGADGDQTVDSDRGVHHFGNEGTDPVARTDIGSNCYLVDDQTVAKTDGTGTRSIAGKVIDVDANGVWVEFA